MQPSWQSHEIRFYLSLAFLVWSLLPHYQLIIHAHGASGDGHSHAALSAEEIALADRALQALPYAEPREFGGEPVSARPAAPGGSAWSPCAGFSSHSHFQQDVNSVPGMVIHPASPAPPPGEAAEDLRYRPPCPAIPADRLARGPPAAFLA